MTEIIQGIILDKSSLKAAIDYFLQQDVFAYDIETTGINRRHPQIAPVTWISLATNGSCIVIPMGHDRGNQIGTERVPTEYKSGSKIGKTYMRTVPLFDRAPDHLDTGTVFRLLSPLFASSSITKVAHNAIFDLVGVSKYLGFVPSPPYADTLIMDWLLDENKNRHGLRFLVESTYEMVYDNESVGKKVEDFPFETVAYYSYCDAKFDFLLYKELSQRIKDENLTGIYELEMQVLNVMVGMKLAGARVDVPALHSLREKLSKDLTEKEARIYRAAGHRFNINSNPQKIEVLFNEQGLRPWKSTKGGNFSVDDSVLESYPDNAVCRALREYGDVSKILSTYVDSWLGTEEEPSLIFDGHIHADFVQSGTVTGRMSCRRPNLQNLPRSSSELGKMVRDIFIAEDGGKLIVADYSQIELVVLAHYIGEGKLYEGFLEGIDPHTMTAAMVLDKYPSDITKTERQDMGKTMNFAIVYGAGIHKIASMANITADEAKAKLRKHQKMFPEIHKFKQDVIDLARSREIPYITTLMGRKRRVPELNSSDSGIRMGAERQVFNSLIQGSAADIMKLAMVRMDMALPVEAKLILSVHDEIVTSCPAVMVENVLQITKEAMTGPDIQKYVDVPLRIDINAGNSWGQVK